MREYLFAVSAVLLFPAVSPAVILKKPLSPCLFHVPAPQPTAEAAASKMVYDSSVNQFQPGTESAMVHKEFDKLREEIMRPESASQAEMDQLQDPAFQKKLQNMSEAEKMAWAMKMQQPAPSAPAQTDP